MSRPSRRLMHRLALRIGCTLEELGQRMTAAEFREWEAFDAMDPIGDYRMDAVAANATAHLVAASSTSRRQFFIADFEAKWWVPAKAYIEMRRREARQQNVGQKLLNIVKGFVNRGDEHQNDRG